MFTIYLVDTELDKITITHTRERSMALPWARGILHVNDPKNRQKKYTEMWLGEERATWLQYENSPIYCLVKQSSLS